MFQMTEFWLILFLHLVTLAKSPEALRRNLLSHSIEAFSGRSKLSLWLYLAEKGAVKTSVVLKVPVGLVKTSLSKGYGINTSLLGS